MKSDSDTYARKEKPQSAVTLQGSNRNFQRNSDSTSGKHVKQAPFINKYPSSFSSFEASKQRLVEAGLSPNEYARAVTRLARRFRV